MTTKDELIQEIEQAPEPLLKQVLEFIRSRKTNQVDPVEAYLGQLRANGGYADDVTPEELAESDAAYQDYLSSKDPGISLEELKRELLEKGGDRGDLQIARTGNSSYQDRQNAT